jgi:Domain of unknown function (DUF4386)
MPNTSAKTGRITATFPRLQARIAGFISLIAIVGGIFAEIFVRGRLVVHGDPAATAHNILTHELLFKQVNRTATLLVVFFNLVGTAIESVSLLAHSAPLVLLGNGHHFDAFTSQQLEAWAYVSLELFEYGFAIALVFFGFDCLSMGYLISKSTFLPRFIGVLLAIEGVLYLTSSFANFLAPAIAIHVFPFLAASAVAEISLCLWLLVVGVNVPKWQNQASAVHGGAA